MAAVPWYLRRGINVSTCITYVCRTDMQKFRRRVRGQGHLFWCDALKTALRSKSNGLVRWNGHDPRSFGNEIILLVSQEARGTPIEDLFTDESSRIVCEVCFETPASASFRTRPSAVSDYPYSTPFPHQPLRLPDCRLVRRKPSIVEAHPELRAANTFNHVVGPQTFCKP